MKTKLFILIIVILLSIFAIFVINCRNVLYFNNERIKGYKLQDKEQTLEIDSLEAVITGLTNQLVLCRYDYSQCKINIELISAEVIRLNNEK